MLVWDRILAAWPSARDQVPATAVPGASHGGRRGKTSGEADSRQNPHPSSEASEAKVKDGVEALHCCLPFHAWRCVFQKLSSSLKAAGRVKSGCRWAFTEASIMQRMKGRAAGKTEAANENFPSSDCSDLRDVCFCPSVVSIRAWSSLRRSVDRASVWARVSITIPRNSRR